MAIIRVAGERCDMGDELSALAAMQRGGDADLDPEFRQVPAEWKISANTEPV
jgi:hypothetical protein